MKKILFGLIITIFFFVFQPSYLYAAGEEEAISPSFGAEYIDGILNDVYGAYTVNGEVYYGLRSGNFLEAFGNARNANKTGVGNSFDGIVKNALGDGYGGKQGVHGSYKTNSNSCASCHITHSAPGKKLLFKTTIWNTCTTCHDGTLGILNVMKLGAVSRENFVIDENDQVTNLYSVGAGTFAGPSDEGSSMHMATGILKIKAAPGGNRNGDNTNPSLGSTWGAEFSCASCHSPHGSYSPRLLHYNPNGVGNEVASLGGYKKEAIPVWNAVYNGETKYFVSANNLEITSFGARDTSPWLYGYEYGSPKQYWTEIIVKDSVGETVYPPEGKAWNDIFEINYGKAYFTIPEGVIGTLIPANAELTMNIAPAMVVNITLSETIVRDGVKELIDYGDETRLNQFCSACHTDYITSVGGVFSNSHRHRVDIDAVEGMVQGKNGKAVCLSCHLAHGTTATFMLNSDNTLIPDEDSDGQLDYIDIDTSSALKRYVNKSVCLKCHNF